MDMCFSVLLINSLRFAFQWNSVQYFSYDLIKTIRYLLLILWTIGWYRVCVWLIYLRSIDLRFDNLLYGFSWYGLCDVTLSVCLMSSVEFMCGVSISMLSLIACTARRINQRFLQSAGYNDLQLLSVFVLKVLNGLSIPYGSFTFDLRLVSCWFSCLRPCCMESRLKKLVHLTFACML